VTRGGSIGILKPGQQASINSANELKIGDADVDAVMAWKSGLFHFSDASLQEVMRQIVQWYDVEVVYQGEIPERKFGGEISRNANLSQVLKILEESKVHFRIEDKKLIVFP
jgi:ferric-dicitrate binding protein FerR (iron transport regulator)